MATAEKTSTTVTTTTVTLTLSEEEASTLFAVLSMVGGCPNKSPRKHTGAVREAVSDVLGYRWSADAPEYRYASPKRTGIYFSDYA